MKDLLNEYYGLKIEYSREYQQGLVFFVNGDYYYLCKTYLTIDDINISYDLYLLLKRRGIVLHDFIFNKENKLLSNGYVLLKLNYLIDKIDLSDLQRTNIKVDFDIKDDFYQLWVDKIDYYEEKLFVDEDIGYVCYSFDYFIGISELLLNFYKDNKIGLDSNYIVHRSFITLSTIDYYNPLNIVVGDKLKDYSSYIRLTNDWQLLYDILNVVNQEEKSYLFVRLAFPFRYFYYINMLLYDKANSKVLLNIVDEIDLYEKYLIKLEEFVGIKMFYWIKKDN
jgi:hypothetical protein